MRLSIWHFIVKNETILYWTSNPNRRPPCLSVKVMKKFWQAGLIFFSTEVLGWGSGPGKQIWDPGRWRNMQGAVGIIDILYLEEVQPPALSSPSLSIGLFYMQAKQRRHTACRLPKRAHAHKPMFMTLSTYTEPWCLRPWLHTKNIALWKPWQGSITIDILSLPYRKGFGFVLMIAIGGTQIFGL